MKILNYRLIILLCATTSLIGCGQGQDNNKRQKVDSTYADSIVKVKMSEIPLNSRLYSIKNSKVCVFHGVTLGKKYTF